MIPSLGRIVHLRLSAECALQINKRRADARASKVSTQMIGVQVHVGNPVAEGDEFPLLITRVWAGPDKATEHTAVNGQVFLDGNDCLWVTSVVQGDGPGQWHEPERI